MEATVALAFEDLWGDVGRCAALLGLQLVPALDELGHSKVADLDVTFGGQQDVVELDISMEDFLAVDIDESMDQLAEDEFGEIFLELSSASDVGEEVTTAAHFNDVDGVRSCIKAFVQPNNVLMPRPLEYVVLLHDLLQRALIRHVGLIDGFEGNELPSQSMYGQVDFSKRSLANDFSYLIIVYFRIVDFVLNI